MSTFTGESTPGQPGTGPDDAELTLLQRVLTGLKGQPAESSSDEGRAA